MRTKSKVIHTTTNIKKDISVVFINRRYPKYITATNFNAPHKPNITGCG
jgi:hypothetical protein